MAVRLIAVRAIGRDRIELSFDHPIKVRDRHTVLPPHPPPKDRYTPIDWISLGGISDDGANPLNYSITRPQGGHLSQPAKAVDLRVVYAREAPGYFTDIGSQRYASRIYVQTDFQHTARAGYELRVRNVSGQDGQKIEVQDGTRRFVGFIVSQEKDRDFQLFDQLPPIAQRDDVEIGDLKTFLDACQELFDRLIEDVDAFVWELCDIDRMRAEYLDGLLEDLGNPFTHMGGLSDLQKRKLAAVLVQMYREKSTCKGMINALRFFLGIEMVGCRSGWTGCWRLGEDQLGVGTTIGPGSLDDIYSFWLLHREPSSIGQEQARRIKLVVDYLKPVHTNYLGICPP